MDDSDTDGSEDVKLHPLIRPGACLPSRFLELRGLADRIGPLDPSPKHQNLRSSRVEGLGDWLLRTEEFINWNTGEDGVVSPILFCYGDPGVGKTHIGYELALPCENRGV